MRGSIVSQCSTIPFSSTAPVVEENGGNNDLSIWGHVMQGRVSHVAEILLSLVSVNGVIVSINPQWWHWAGEVPPTRVRGRIMKLTSKRAGTEQLSIEWELGSGDDGYRAGQVTYTQPEVADLSKPSATMGKFLSDAQYAFTLEPYADGTPAPTVVTKEADMALAAPFLLARPDFSKTEVVKAYSYSIVSPVMDYWKQTIEVKKGAQLARM